MGGKVSGWTSWMDGYSNRRMDLNFHFGLQWSRVYPSLKIPWLKRTFPESHCVPDTSEALGPKVDILALGDLTQISKETRTFSWRYACGAPCLTGGAGEMVVQEKGPKGSATWMHLEDCQFQKRRFRFGGVVAWGYKSQGTRRQPFVRTGTQGAVTANETGRWGRSQKLIRLICICQLFQGGNLMSLSDRF